MEELSILLYPERVIETMQRAPYADMLLCSKMLE